MGHSPSASIQQFLGQQLCWPMEPIPNQAQTGFMYSQVDQQLV
jgi:hypothetical protein